jgi:hypothetical protein
MLQFVMIPSFTPRQKEVDIGKLGAMIQIVEQMAKADNMADRMQFLGVAKPDPELVKALEASRETVVTEEELREQRISFAFGNAPAGATNITKESVRQASEHIRLLK